MQLMVELKHRFGLVRLVIGSAHLLLVLVPVAIAVWMMTGKRKQVMDENIDEKLKTNE